MDTRDTTRPATTGKTALIYVRRSVVRNQADRVSPERQRANCIAEAERQGWRYELYEDAEGHRSGRTEQRPGWLALKAQLHRQDVAAVIVESLSRASRSTKDLLSLIADLESRGITLVSLKEQVDTASAVGRAFVGLIAVLNQFESDIASERMAAAIAFKRETKGRHWGLTPFGCDREGPDCVLVPTEEGAEVAGIWRGYHDALNTCYSWYATGLESLDSLAERLNAAGYRFRDRNGDPRPFTQDDVRRLLAANRIYAGYVLDGRAKDASAAVVREGSHDPILPVELCDRVADQLEARAANPLARRFGGRHGPGRVYLLSSFLYCAACGQRMVGAWQDGKKWYRHVRRKGPCTVKGQVKCGILDPQVFELLSGFRLPEEMKARILAEAKRRAAAAGQPRRKRLIAELRRSKQRLETLKEMRLEGEIGRAEYYRRKERLSLAIADLEAELGPVSGGQTLPQLLSQIDQVAEVIAAGTPQQQKAVLNTIFVRMEIRNGEIEAYTVQPWAQGLF